MKFPAVGKRVEQIQQIVDCMHATGLHVDNGNVVFGPDSSDSRDNSCAVRMVATVGDGALGTIKHVAEAFPYALTLPFRLNGLGGFDFNGSPPQANLMRLPWGGAGSDVVAYVRGPLLVSNIYNEERLAHFHERVLAPTVLRIAGTMIAAEQAYFATSSALAADEKQTADVRNASLGRAARAQAKFGTLEALQAQPTQAFWPGLIPLHFYDANDVLDATAQLAECPARGVKDKDRSRLARAFGVESGVMVVHARTQGLEPPMKRRINQVATRLLTITWLVASSPSRVASTRRILTLRCRRMLLRRRSPSASSRPRCSWQFSVKNRLTRARRR